MVTRPSPDCSMRLIKEDRVDRSGCSLLKRQLVTHSSQFRSSPVRRRVSKQDSARPDLVLAKRTPHLKAVDIRRFRRLLDSHSELDDVQEKLQQVLVLTVAALDRKSEERFTIFQRQRRRPRDARMLARFNHVIRTFRSVKDKPLC